MMLFIKKANEPFKTKEKISERDKAVQSYKVEEL
jgi:hypothetical protein